MTMSFALSVPQPCSESWAGMSPTATGRHCAACQKTVVDFTLLTDAEILALLARSSGKVCGRVAASQLGRPLQPLVLAPPSRWRAWLTAAIAVWGLREAAAPPARAQAAVEQRELPANSPLNYSRKPDYEGSAPAPARVLRGRVIDKQTKEALPGVTVIIKGTSIGTVTAADGTFEVRLPDHSPQKKITVEVRYLSYETTQTVLKLRDGSMELQVELSMRVITLGGISFGPVPLPAPNLIPRAAAMESAVPLGPWKPSVVYAWTKYWLTRPFCS